MDRLMAAPTSVAILSRGERGEGVSILSAHIDVNRAMRAARTYAYEGTDTAFPLLNWKRIGDTWTVWSLNNVDYLEIRKVKVES
jgi:hypothetical protein